MKKEQLAFKNWKCAWQYGLPCDP